MCFSVEAKPKKGVNGRIFALQVATNNVRNIICENLNHLITMLRGDHEGDYPKIARNKIAKHYAATGEILTLAEVRVMLAREGSESMKAIDSGGSDVNDSMDSDSDED